MIKIGDFSKLSKVSIRMLRHYNEIGLLEPVYVDEFTSYRFYNAEQLTLINKIKALQDMGFSLATIKDILSAYDDAESLRRYLKIQHSQLKQEAEQMERRLLLLENTLKKLEERKMMEYAVNIKEIPERYVASLRKIIPTFNDERMLWEQKFNETKSQNVQMATPGYGLAIFHDEEYKESDVDVEIQVSVVGSYTDTENVRFKTVAPITVASVIYKGSYEHIVPANEAIAAWVVDNKYDFNGAMFNIYHVSPGHDPNPDNWVTEICYPVVRVC